MGLIVGSYGIFLHARGYGGAGFRRDRRAAGRRRLGGGGVVLSLAKATKDYYLQKLGEISPREDYYLRGGTAAGVWAGSGAADVGLSGSVTAEGLVRLFDGEHPRTGEQLGVRLRRDGVAAWDVTFSADKSVSLLWALGDDDTRRQVLESFERATSEAVAYLESVASSTRGARRERTVDDDGVERVRVVTWPIETSGYVAASFTEFTSRADDPQLHTHVVVANKVQGTDGKWRSLDGRRFYRHQLAAGYLHEAVLRHELTRRLGVGWQPVRNGVADIEGFGRDQIEAFSRRRQQAEEWRNEHGLPETPSARQAAVLATRDAKGDHPFHELETEWRQRAESVGLTPERISRILSEGVVLVPPDMDRLTKGLCCEDGLTARSSTFGRADAVKAIAGSLPTGATALAVQALADGFLARPEVTELAEPTADGERRYTTTELLELEHKVRERALSEEGDRWKAPARLVGSIPSLYPDLNDDQEEMVTRFATSGASIDVGVGPAGSGKTTVMAAVAQLAEMSGIPIVGAALAAKAAVGLQTATGIPSSSLVALERRSQTDGGLPDRVIVVIDEASMVGTRQLAALSDRVEAASGKLILIGDPHQLPELHAGGLFGVLSKLAPAVTLEENHRQQQTWEQQALADLRDGSADRAIAAYRRHRRLVVGTDRADTLNQAVSDWYRYVADTGDPSGALMLAYDRETVADLNQLARRHFARAGVLDGPTLGACDHDYQRGDRIICVTNHPGLGVFNGDLATVTTVDTRTRALTVRLDRHPEPVTLPSWYVDQGHLEHGYALTGHKAQGVTVDRTFSVIGPQATREWFHVAMSRGRESNTAYLTATARGDTGDQCGHVPHLDDTPADPNEVALERIRRSRRQQAAIELTR